MGVLDVFDSGRVVHDTRHNPGKPNFDCLASILFILYSFFSFYFCCQQISSGLTANEELVR